METEKLIAHFRGTDVDIENILRSQDIARDCLCHMEGFLRPGMDREEIHRECERYMLEKGSEGWWIHNDPALILFGDLTTYSAHEDPSPLFEGKRVQENDLITIDVAPSIKTGWGDMARSFVMEEGKIVSWKDCHNKEIREGMEMEMILHELFISFVNENTTFSQLHQMVNDYLQKHGYYNCDYHGNFGHTIENDQKDRVTIDESVDIGIVQYRKPITFEPHICKKNGRYGVKYENMYVCIDGKMREI